MQVLSGGRDWTQPVPMAHDVEQFQIFSVCNRLVIPLPRKVARLPFELQQALLLFIMRGDPGNNAASVQFKFDHDSAKFLDGQIILCCGKAL